MAVLANYSKGKLFTRTSFIVSIETGNLVNLISFAALARSVFACASTLRSFSARDADFSANLYEKIDL